MADKQTMALEPLAVSIKEAQRLTSFGFREGRQAETRQLSISEEDGRLRRLKNENALGDEPEGVSIS